MNNLEQTPKKSGLACFLKTVLFLAVVLAALSGVTELTREKSGDELILLNEELETETEWDVIFAGSSRMNTTGYPMDMWRDYGFTSWNNGQSGEVIPVSYYTCKNIIRRCHPKVLVLETSMFYLNREYGNLMWAHESLDPIASRERIPAILDIVPKGEQSEFLFPLSLYHDRWKEITKSDFTDRNTVRRGCSQEFSVAEDIAAMELMDLPEDEALSPGDIPVEYLDKIVELCEQTGTELLLIYVPGFISAETESLNPTHDMTLEPLNANWLEGYAKEKGVGCINFIKLADQLGLDWWKHRYNYGHNNYWGGEIITAYLGKYLSEHYDLPDRREDPAYQNWNEDLEEYEALIERQLLLYQSGVTESNTPVFILPDLPEKMMITQKEYGDWTANQGVWLSAVNGEGVNNATELALDVGADSVEMRGWMADFWNSAPVRELYLQVGKTILKCEYGSERADVAERFGNEKLRNCGFQITFPVSLLGEDIHEVSFIGVSADGQYLYEPVTYQLEVG